jgi:hypothetical protein
MTTQTKIDTLVQEEVNAGVYHSKAEAEQDIIQTLIKRDVKRGIARGREDIKNGRYKILDDDYISNFVNSLAKEILPNSN